MTNEISIEDLMKSEEFLSWFKSSTMLTNDIKQAATYYQVLRSLKKFYEANQKLYFEDPFSWAVSYPCNWKQIMTPIEFEAWQTIRTKGRIVMYPQYPILNYHIDFANPALKIGLELDGAEFHDREKDWQRDKNLSAVGWKIYRISGKEMCRTNFTETYDLTEQYHPRDEILSKLNYWLFNTGDGVIQAIRETYFNDGEADPFEDESLNETYFQLCSETLKVHQLYHG